MAEKDLHQAHRQRMQQRVAQNGLESLAEHEVLEYLLYFVISRRDTNPIAHALIDRFGSFCQVLEASEEELARVPGVGPGSARLIHLLLPIDRYYHIQKKKGSRKLKNTRDMIDYLVPLYHGLTDEVMYLVMMDDSYQILRVVELNRGLPNTVEISMHTLAQEALNSGGTCALLSHNHPRGSAIPSPQDVNMTRRVASALGLINITLVDHIIVSGPDASSMRASKHFPEYDPLQGRIF